MTIFGWRMVYAKMVWIISHLCVSLRLPTPYIRLLSPASRLPILYTWSQHRPWSVILSRTFSTCPGDFGTRHHHSRHTTLHFDSPPSFCCTCFRSKFKNGLHIRTFFINGFDYTQIPFRFLFHVHWRIFEVENCMEHYILEFFF